MKLKPCPFCGGEAQRDYPALNKHKIGFICSHCKASSMFKDTPEEAIKAWNTRTV